MKKTAILLTLLALLAAACGRSVSRYNEYLTDNKRAGCRPACTVVAGDSNIELGDWSRYLAGDVCNLGVRGYSTVELLREVTVVAALKPSVIVMHVGGNDLLVKRSVPQLTAAYRQIIERYRALTPRVYCVSILPVDRRGASLITNEAIQDVNVRLEAICRETGAVFVNVYPALYSEKRGLNPAYALDMVHLNRNGQNIMGRLIREAIDR